MNKFLTAIAVCSVCFTILSCGAPSDPELTCDASASATLAANVQPLLDAKCTSCHIAGYTYGDYSDATKSAGIVSRASLYAGAGKSLLVVAPGSLANSSLWLKVLGGAEASRTGPKGENVYATMPNDGTTLTAAEKKTLKDWICSGAK